MRVDRFFTLSGALGSAVALHQGAYRTATALALVSAVALCSIKESSCERERRGGRRRSSSAPPALSSRTLQPLSSIQLVLPSKGVLWSPPIEKSQKEQEPPMPPLPVRSRSFQERLSLLIGPIPRSRVPEIVDGVYDLRADPDYRLNWHALFGDRTLCFEIGDLDGVAYRATNRPTVALTNDYREARAIRDHCTHLMVILFPSCIGNVPYFDAGRLDQVQVRLLNSVPLYPKGQTVEMYETQSFPLFSARLLQKGLREGGELRLIFKEENGPFIDAFKRKFQLSAAEKDWGFSAEPREESRIGERHLVYIRQPEGAKS